MGAIVEHDDLGSDFVDDGGDGGGPGDETMAIILWRIETLCATYKRPIREVAEAVAGYSAFLDDEIDLGPNSTPPARSALDAVRRYGLSSRAAYSEGPIEGPFSILSRLAS